MRNLKEIEEIDGTTWNAYNLSYNKDIKAPSLIEFKFKGNSKEERKVTVKNNV